MRKALLILLPLAALVAAASALGAGSGPTVLSRSDIGDVFDPAKVTVAVGTTVHWHNESGKHNVVFNKSGKRLGGDPETHAPTADHWDAQFKFTQAGTFKYYCSEHSDGTFGMVGKVVVYDPKAPPPKITKLHAKPSSFCTDKSATCDKRGTKVVFTLDQDAKVTGTIKRASGGTAKTVFKNKQRSKGKDTIKFSGKGLKPGKYVLKLRARGLNGKTSDPVTTKVTVVDNG